MTRNRMTEAEIEYHVEKVIDDLDVKLLNGSITEAEYDREISKIDQWASIEYRYLEETRSRIHKMKDEYSDG